MQIVAELESVPLNLRIPEISLDVSTVTFSPLSFNEAQSRSVTISNVSEAVAQFDFDGRVGVDLKKRFPSWLEILPRSGIIYPHKDQVITIKIRVDKSSAENIMIGKDQLASKIVIKVQDKEFPSEHQIDLEATFVQTSMGCSLALLNTLSNPLCSYQSAELAKLKKTADPVFAVPKVLNFQNSFPTEIAR